MSDNHPGSGDDRPAYDGDEETARLWQRGQQPEPSYDPSGAPSTYGAYADPYAAPYADPSPYGAYADPSTYGAYADPSTYGAYADPYAGAYGGYYAPQPPRPQPGARLAGWVWPVVAATALVVGILGGTVGGVLVTAVDRVAGSAPATTVFDGEDSAPAPLDPANGSVAAVAKALLPSTVQILTRGGSGAGGAATGSGFVVDRQGHVITNNHVVAGVADAGRIEVVDHRGRRLSATIVGRSPVYDIAVLDVDGAEDLQPAALGSSRSMNIGETVVAIGSPLGLSSTVTSGIVSALDRPVTTGDEDESSFINAVQTDAAINPGNSGGPLVNLRGEVVGVNSAIATTGGFGSRPGSIGVGFAIPMEQVEVTASQIVRTGEAKYPVIGANVNTGSRRNGAEIVDVPAGTPAARAGLQEGDIVVAVEEKPVTDGIGLIVAIRSHQPGETITLVVRRDGRERTLRITLDAKVG